MVLGDSVRAATPTEEAGAPGQIPFRARRGSAHTFHSSLYPIQSQASAPHQDSGSYLSHMLQRDKADDDVATLADERVAPKDVPVQPPSERDALLPRNGVEHGPREGYRTSDDLECQGLRQRGAWKLRRALTWPVEKGKDAVHHVKNHKKITKKELWENGVLAPVSYLPAVVLGLLLNVLDGLSYGKTPMKPFPAGVVAEIYRHDSVPAWARYILRPWPRWTLHVLRVMYRFAIGVFVGRKCVQGWNRIRNGRYSQPSFFYHVRLLKFQRLKLSPSSTRWPLRFFIPWGIQILEP